MATMNDMIRQAAGRQPAAPVTASPEQVRGARITAGVLGVSVAEALKVHCWPPEPEQTPPAAKTVQVLTMNQLIHKIAGRG